MENYIFSGSLKALSEFLLRYYGKKVIILLDEYDTPMQEAYVNGYWQEMVDFMKGLMVDLADEYTITSNRESGFGRYDVVLEPQERGRNMISNSSNGEVMSDHCSRDVIIIEFKVHDPENEKDLKESVQAALRQIEEKQYAAALEAKGIPGDKIRKYGFAFEGKKILIGS